MAQLLAACVIFMIPMRKKKHFWVRVSVAAVALILASYIINDRLVTLESGKIVMWYWASYMVAIILYARIALEGDMMQVICCGMSACGMQHIAFDIYLCCELGMGSSRVAGVIIYVGVYAATTCFLLKKLPQQEDFPVSKETLFPLVTIILLVLIFSVFEGSQFSGFEAGTYQRILYRLIDGLCCYYVLWVQLNRNENIRLQRELNGIYTVWREQKKQYQVTKETIESINRRCHDLKHQIRLVQTMTDEQEKAEFLSEMERDIMIYDTALDTGNKALDTVLMEKGLLCRTNGIQWSCMADGRRLDFMRLDDIYAMFGNALDNAIRAVMKLGDPNKRIISVKILSQEDILVIQIQNYYEGELRFEDGLPVTTKKNKRDHGYGMKSIRYTAEKYKGTITAQAKNQIFTLQILIPVGGAH
jgi:hypothetical protein